MMQDSNDFKFPDFLSSYEQFYDHIQNIMENLSTTGKGKSFAEFGRSLIKVTDFGRQFHSFELQQSSHDGGVDIVAVNKERTAKLYVQSKYSIGSVDDIDAIISKFHNYEITYHAPKDPVLIQGNLFGDDRPQDVPLQPQSLYLIFTASLLSGQRKLANYEESNRPSRRFYRELVDQKRLIIMDGREIFRTAQAAYRKSHFLPTNVELGFAEEWITLGNVYVGILSGTVLTRLYETYGDSLFLENIRSWLGPTTGYVPKSGRQSPNEAIANTIEKEPLKLLGRNNGITFRAGQVKKVDEKTLLLNAASIVNGCQTTMSLVTAQSDTSSCHVLAKIVETDDAWDIAGSANFQTKVDRIDIDVAKFVRYQALREVADKYGYQLLTGPAVPSSIFSVFESITRADVRELEIRATFIGLFSRTPNNAIIENYTELNANLLDEYAEDLHSDELLEVLFKLNDLSGAASRELQGSSRLGDTMKALFKRFWAEDTGKSEQYRAFLTIFAACDLISTNIYEKERTYEGLRQALNRVRDRIDVDQTAFIKSYENAFKALTVRLLDPQKTVDEIAQHMSSYIEKANFATLFLAVETYRSS